MAAKLGLLKQGTQED